MQRKQIDWDDPKHPRHQHMRKSTTYKTWIDEGTGEWMFGVGMQIQDIGGRVRSILSFKVTEIIADKTWCGW